MDFSEALRLLKDGYRVSRSSWQMGEYVELQQPDAHSKMTIPYLFISASGERCPWLPWQGELLADDWGLYMNQPKEYPPDKLTAAGSLMVSLQNALSYPKHDLTLLFLSADEAMELEQILSFAIANGR